MRSIIFMLIAWSLLGLASISRCHSHENEDNGEIFSDKRDTHYEQHPSDLALVQRLKPEQQPNVKQPCVEVMTNVYYADDYAWIPPYDLNVSTLQDCIARCDSVPTCVAWAYNITYATHCVLFWRKGTIRMLESVLSGACDRAQKLSTYYDCGSGKQCWRGCVFGNDPRINGPRWCYELSVSGTQTCANKDDCSGGGQCFTPCG